MCVLDDLGPTLSRRRLLGLPEVRAVLDDRADALGGDLDAPLGQPFADRGECPTLGPLLEDAGQELAAHRVEHEHPVTLGERAAGDDRLAVPSALDRPDDPVEPAFEIDLLAPQVSKRRARGEVDAASDRAPRSLEPGVPILLPLRLRDGRLNVEDHPRVRGQVRGVVARGSRDESPACGDDPVVGQCVLDHVPAEAVDVADDQPVRLARLDLGDEPTEVAVVGPDAPGHVEFGDDLSDLEPLALSPRASGGFLLLRRAKRITLAASDFADSHVDVEHGASFCR